MRTIATSLSNMVETWVSNEVVMSVSLKLRRSAVMKYEQAKDVMLVWYKRTNRACDSIIEKDNKRKTRTWRLIQVILTQHDHNIIQIHNCVMWD